MHCRCERGLSLGQCEDLQPPGECDDTARQRRGLDLFEHRDHPDDRHLSPPRMRDRPLARGRGPVVFLYHFRAKASFEDQLLVRQETVRKVPILFPDLVQEIQDDGSVSNVGDCSGDLFVHESGDCE